MSDPKAWYKPVQVISGPPWCQGRAGYLDETSGTVFFGPAREPPDRDTEFENGYSASLLTIEPVRGKPGRSAASAKIKSAVTDAFQT